MTTQQIAALALGALLVFWMIGAYNRVIVLRNGVAQAWTKVDDALQRRSAAAEPLHAALREPLAAEAGALEAWRRAAAESARAAAAMGARPLRQDHAAAWVVTESALAAAASRVFALLDQHAALRAQADVAAWAAEWHDAQARLAFARQLFNETAAPYDDAITTFPTRLLAPLFRFGRAGRL